MLSFSDPLFLIIAAALSYLLGSIPFGVIFAKFKGVDIRKTGSGNIGTSNAFRALGPLIGTLVFLFDTMKGYLPVFAGGLYSIASDRPLIQILLGICSVLGHNYSVFLNMKGGKGVATSFGVFLALSPLVALSGLAVWAITVLVSRISSLASLIAAAALPVLMLLFHQPLAFIVFSIIAAGLVFYMHKANIRRLMAGTELKMSTKENKNVSEENNS